MSRLQDLTSAPARDLLGNMAYSKAALAIGTTKSAINTTAALNYTVNGVMYTKAAMTSQALTGYSRDGKQLGNTYVQPANTTVFYTISINAAGTTVAATQGTYAGQPLTSPAYGGVSAVGDGLVPNAPDGFTPFGVIKVVTGSATFTLGTTLFDAANLTSTFYDVGVLPQSL